MPNKYKFPKGHLHPLTQTLARAINILGDMGFETIQGPEITSEWNNFDSVLVGKDHPARDTQDTFWTTDGRVLRTHTSAMQVPAMTELGKKPPVRIIVPGRIYRNEATDATHEATFYQLEGFVIDKEINMGHLVWTLKNFLNSMLKTDIEMKFYPHHFPYVELGMEVMIKWRGKWLELLGSGLIHPDVIKNMKLDPKVWHGFAFGVGVDRLMMLERGIDDIRLTYSGDLRFLKQF